MEGIDPGGPPDLNNLILSGIDLKGNHRPEPGEARSIIVNVHLSIDEKEELRAYCAEHRMTMSDLLRLGAFSVIMEERAS
jgi:hypothetical protein